MYVNHHYLSQKPSSLITTMVRFFGGFGVDVDSWTFGNSAVFGKRRMDTENSSVNAGQTHFGTTVKKNSIKRNKNWQTTCRQFPKAQRGTRFCSSFSCLVCVQSNLYVIGAISSCALCHLKFEEWSWTWIIVTEF